MNPNIVALLEDIKNGKSLSFDAIYQLYIPLIESTAKYYCKRFSLSDSEMDDIRQEAAIALYNAAIAYEPEKNIPFGAFAKVCLRNRILSYIRYFHENQTSESLDDVDAEPDIPVSETPEQLMINKESLTELHHRIDEMLTDFEKSVFPFMLVACLTWILPKPYLSQKNPLTTPFIESKQSYGNFSKESRCNSRKGLI